MVNLDKSFGFAEKALLKSLKGRTLLAEGHVPVSGNMAFGRVRLYFAGGEVDVVVSMRPIDFAGDGEPDDDEALMSVELASEGLELASQIDGDELKTDFGKVVERVLVVQDRVICRQEGATSLEFTYSQAVLLDLGDELLCVDKQDGPWEMIAVKRGASPDALVYDCSEEWKVSSTESPGLSNEFKQEIVSL